VFLHGSSLSQVAKLQRLRLQSVNPTRRQEPPGLSQLSVRLCVAASCGKLCDEYVKKHKEEYQKNDYPYKTNGG
jgi:hypothetical protein